MVRENYIQIVFDDEEWAEIEQRAKTAHLPLATYIRWFLFYNHQQQQQIIYTAGMSKTEGIIQLRKSEQKVYDPYTKLREEAYRIFSESGALIDLHNILRKKKPLNEISKEVQEEIKKQKEERKIIVNKHLQGIKRAIKNGKLKEIPKTD